MVVILEKDTVNDTAIKIYKEFAVGQSCAIKGFELNYTPKEGKEIDWTKVDEKGQLVWNQIYLMDRAENCHKDGVRKVRNAGKNTIGGVLAGKIFKFHRVVIDNSPKWTIWRMQ